MRGLRKAAAALLGILLVAAGTEPARAQDLGGAAPSAVLVEREAFLMGTRLRVQLAAADREAGIEVIEEVFRLVEHVEETLSDFDPDAELARVNATELGVAVALSDALAGSLAEAFSWSERTGGAFDPVVGSLVAAWDLRGAGRVPTRAELQRARQSAGRHAVDFDPVARTLVRNAPHVGIDPGGFGKGEALRAAALRLNALGVGNAVMDFGGQIQVLGEGVNLGRSAWEIGVAHPFDRAHPVAALALRDVSASTSGPSERARLLDARLVSHHVDPRTGRPVDAWGSVTVVSHDAFVADALSTALYVMGPDEGMAWAGDMHDVGVLFLTVDGSGAVRARMNAGMERWWVAGSFEGTLEKGEAIEDAERRAPIIEEP